MQFARRKLLIEAGEEGEDDARSACPSDTLGYTRDTIAHTTGRNAVKGGANPYKVGASLD